MLRKTALFSSKDNGFSWWWLGVKVGVVTALVLLWWLENKNRKNLQGSMIEETPGDTKAIPLPVEETVQVETAAIKPPEPSAIPPTEPDDLTKIEGIGPKISTTLQEAGIRTYTQLAASEAAVLKKVLSDAGIRIGQPDTWPEQAALAAKADWTALKELQSSLQGGRRVG